VAATVNTVYVAAGLQTRPEERHMLKRILIAAGLLVALVAVTVSA
jgi:hypothetical protein